MHHYTARRPRMLARHTSKLPLVLGVAALCGIAASTQPLAAQEVPDWAQEVEQRWWDAFNAGNSKRLVSLFASDAVALHPSQTLRGNERIEQFFTAVFLTASYDCEWSVKRALTLDQLATVTSSARCSKVPERGDPESISLDMLKVYEQQDDGSWLMVRAIARPPLQP